MQRILRHLSRKTPSPRKRALRFRTPRKSRETRRTIRRQTRAVKVTTVGRGNVGSGLGELWRRAGHEVVELGRDGGDATGSDAALLCVPQTAIADALASVRGLESVPVIDAINAVRAPRPDGFESLAEYVKSLTGGPVAKAFNSNFARLYDRLGDTRATPSMVYAADEEAREVTERLIRDAGYEPVSAGGLENARAVEDFIGVIFAVAGESGPFFYRIAPPDRL
jgi:8-hydroxy-5-deazaflavin:NADPH oxidoreductase